MKTARLKTELNCLFLLRAINVVIVYYFGFQIPFTVFSGAWVTLYLLCITFYGSSLVPRHSLLSKHKYPGNKFRCVPFGDITTQDRNWLKGSQGKTIASYTVVISEVLLPFLWTLPKVCTFSFRLKRELYSHIIIWLVFVGDITRTLIG